jgi:hypothetical protein
VNEKQPARLLNFRLWIECFLLLLLPGRHGLPLDGIPINGPFEGSLLVILVLALIQLILERYRVTFNWRQPDGTTLAGPQATFGQWFQRYDSRLFLLGLLVKAVLFASNFVYPPATFKISYFVSTADGEQQAYSFDNPFKLDNATLVIDQLKSDATRTYENWYQNDNAYRGKKVRLTVSGLVSNPNSQRLRLVYTGPLHGRVGNASVAAGAGSAEPSSLEISTTGRTTRVELEISNLTGSRLKLEEFDGKGWQSARAASDSEMRWLGPLAVFGNLISAVIITTLAALFAAAFFAAMSLHTPFLLLLLTVPLMLWGHIDRCFPILMLGAFFGAMLEKARFGRIQYAAWLLVIFLSVFLFGMSKLHLSRIEIRAGTEDPLTYESHGRLVRKERSLRAGEDVFYYQPGYRYVMAGMLTIFGERNLFPKTLNLALYVAVFWLFAVWLMNSIRPTNVSFVSMAVGLYLMSRVAIANVFFNLSEFVAWMLLAGGLMFALAGFEWKHFRHPHIVERANPAWALYAFAACIGLAAIIRPNQLPGLSLCFGGVLAWAFTVDARRSWKDYVGPAATFAAIILLPLWHNVYYGHQWILMSKGLTQNVTTYVLPPARFFANPLSSENVAALTFQLKHLFVLPTDTPWLSGLKAVWPFHALIILFVVSIIRAAIKRLWLEILASLIILIAFAGVHLFYQIDNYYPRHIIVVYWLVSVFATLFWSDIPMNSRPA